MIKRSLRRSLPSATVPISRVRNISLFAMQVGVDPCASGAFVLLGRFVSARPIALGIPPQSGQRELGGRVLVLERIAKFLQGHTPNNSNLPLPPPVLPRWPHAKTSRPLPEAW